MIASSAGTLDRLSLKFDQTSKTWSPKVLEEELNTSTPRVSLYAQRGALPEALLSASQTASGKSVEDPSATTSLRIHRRNLRLQNQSLAKDKPSGDEEVKNPTENSSDDPVNEVGYLRKRRALIGLQAQQKTLVSKQIIPKDYSVKQLVKDLASTGIDTTELFRGGKTPHELLDDLTSGKSELVLDTGADGAIRISKRVHLARVLITAVDHRSPFKPKNVMVKKTHDKTTIPAKKFKSSDTTWEQVVRRLLINDLSLSDRWVDQHIRYVNGSLNCWEEQEESSAYKGLNTIRFVEQGELVISHPENLWYVLGMPTFVTFVTAEKTSGQGMHAVKNHTWNWVPFNEIIETFPMPPGTPSNPNAPTKQLLNQTT